MNNINSFVIENCLNSSDITSLFVSMFFKPSFIQNILCEYPKDSKFLYLQELIYTNFVSNIQNQYFIDSSIINEIRNYMIFTGWENAVDILKTHNVNNLYKFIINGIKPSKTEYIELTVNNNCSLKELLNEKNINLKEDPTYIAITLIRHDNSQIDIQHGINFFTNPIIWWKMHSIVCYSEQGYYYSIVYLNKNWYLYSHSKLPSLSKIDISTEYFSSKIKQECVLIFYTH